MGYAPGLAPAPGASSQFHAQDEFGQFSFGHAGGPLARSEARNAYGITTGSYQYVDANGLLQTAQYVADPVNGFRVSATNLPVAPAAPVVAPLVAPVFGLPLPVAPQATAEVAAATAAHLEALAAADAAAAAAPAEERKKREAEDATPIIVNPYAAGIFAGHGVYAAAPAQIVASIENAAPVTAALPATYALPAGLPYAAGLPATYAAGLPYGLPAGVAAPPAAAPVAAAPSREAVITTIKANPGHAIVYTVQ